MKIAFNNYLYESIDNLPFTPKGSIPTAHIPIFSTFKGIKDQLDSFTQPVGFIWVIVAYDSINHIILMGS